MTWHNLEHPTERLIMIIDRHLREGMWYISIHRRIIFKITAEIKTDRNISERPIKIVRYVTYNERDMTKSRASIYDPTAMT